MLLDSLPPVDRALAQRLERAEALANVASVDARRAVEPASGAEWMEVGGVYAMFDGAESPLTQTFGLGLFDSFLEPEFEAVEAFFSSRGAPTFHEVSALAAPETLALLSSRGYSPIEASVVLVRSTADSLPESSAIDVRAIGSEEIPLWCDIARRGWGSESPELGEFVAAIGAVMARARGVTCFVAETRGEPVAAGTLNISNGVALLAGATTVPEARRRGAQLALLQARLGFAASRGIDLAMIVTQPGSGSQRNAERRGFRPMYTRVKWRRDGAGA